MRPCLVTILLIGSLAAGVAGAADLDAGLRAYHGGDYERALELWRPLAEAGDREAQLVLAYMHRRGIGTAADAEEAARWYRKAAKQGVPEAQYQLGLMYEIGHGVPTDIWEAESWYQRALSHGYCLDELRDGGRLAD